MADAYLQALRLLARRELSEAQVRTRLRRRGHLDADIEAAIDRLRSERAIDDGRTAAAIARTQLALRPRGRLRVRQQIERAGIAPALADHAVEAAFGGIETGALIEAVLARRLRGRAIAGEAEFRRQYRYLLSEGFEPDEVLAALERHRRRGAGAADD